ncbi:MAG: ABC transporter ATP-binding protein [Anaerolineales bacterium]
MFEESSMLKVENLRKYFAVTSGMFSRKVGEVKAVDDVSFMVPAGKTFALVGESGSGKTTVGKTVIRLLRPSGGKIHFNDTDISSLPERQLKTWRRQMQMVFQDPASALNPRRRVVDIIAMPLRVHRSGSWQEQQARVRELLDLVQLPEKFLYKYPHALSGGEKQRVSIARALALNPHLVILDEPTSALDVSVQAKILKLLAQLQDELGLTYLLISHDLGVVKNFSTDTAVMYLGKIMERTTTEKLFAKPLHPYTQSLLSAIPVITDEELRLIPERITLEGDIPSPMNAPPGCVFHTRCLYRMKVCSQVMPEFIEVEAGHHVWCHLFTSEGSEGHS